MDYQKLGLKIGLEIHQQLEGKKLFCQCSTILRDDQPDFTIVRKLRAVAGEAGEIDIAAAHEQVKNKEFHYQGYDDTTCLVETDSEPPHEINTDALHTALQVAAILHASVPSIIQVMRKTVIDGSNTSGFQRTALVGRNGVLKTTQGNVAIENISLEEDACRIIAERKNETIYRLDRLGIPLIEIGTKADIHTPEQAVEAAKILGNILRSLPGVKRGLGTIRQDVNISIKKGSRVEIKGVQDIRLLPKIIDKEIERQRAIISKGKKVLSEVRKVNADGSTSYLRPMPGAARMYPETDVPLIRPDTTSITLPELIDEKIERFIQSYHLSRDLAEHVAKSDNNALFEELVQRHKSVKPSFIAEVLTSYVVEIRRKYKQDTQKLSDDHFRELFALLDQGKIHKDIVLDVLIDYAKGTFDLKRYETLGTEDIHQELQKIIETHPGAPFGALMGIAVKKLAGKASGKTISEELKKLLTEHHTGM
jgi:Glu-tRNA(Gln) amidotransferase subunit E-like FAD-binding protein